MYYVTPCAKLNMILHIVRIENNFTNKVLTIIYHNIKMKYMMNHILGNRTEVWVECEAYDTHRHSTVSNSAKFSIFIFENLPISLELTTTVTLCSVG